MDPKVKDKKQSKKTWNLRECKYYKENYGRFLAWGMFLPKNYFQNVFYLIILIIHIPLWAYGGALMVEEEFADFTEVFHFLVLLVLSFLGCAIISCLKSSLVSMIRMLDEGLHNYGDTIDEETAEEINHTTEKIRKRKYFCSQFMIYGLTISAFTILCRPAYDWAIGTFETPNYKHNIHRMVPVKMYHFLDPSSIYAVVIVNLIEYYILFQTSLIVIASTTLYITTSEELCVELSTLNITLKNLKRRAEFASSGHVDKKVLLDCLKRCIIHHLNIIKCFKAFQKVYYWILWLILTISTYMMCLCGFLMTMDGVEMKLTNRITSIFFLVLETFHLLVYCWYGEEIQTRSSQLHFNIYDCDWLGHSIILKNSMNIIQLRTLNPLKLTCGGLMFANLNTFSNIVNTAYSYFNLLKAST